MNKKLDKDEFMRFLERKEIFHGHALINKFGDQGFFLFMNLGVPQLLLKSISQFTGKSINELMSDDASKLYHTIKETFGHEKNNYNEITKFRKQHNLSFFGMSQYNLLEYYIQQISSA